MEKGKKERIGRICEASNVKKSPLQPSLMEGGGGKRKKGKQKKYELKTYRDK